MFEFYVKNVMEQKEGKKEHLCWNISNRYFLNNYEKKKNV